MFKMLSQATLVLYSVNRTDKLETIASIEGQIQKNIKDVSVYFHSRVLEWMTIQLRAVLQAWKIMAKVICKIRLTNYICVRIVLVLVFALCFGPEPHGIDIKMKRQDGESTERLNDMSDKFDKYTPRYI